MQWVSGLISKDGVVRGALKFSRTRGWPDDKFCWLGGISPAQPNWEFSIPMPVQEATLHRTLVGR